MKKKLIRLTEGDLHRIIKESVNRILKESETTDADMYWSEGDLISVNTHNATYYPNEDDVEFDVRDYENGIPFVIEPVLNMDFEDWDVRMIDDIDWGVDYYSSPGFREKYAMYEDKINQFMEANKDFYLNKLRRNFKTP